MSGVLYEVFTLKHGREAGEHGTGSPKRKRETKQKRSRVRGKVKQRAAEDMLEH